jgi:two-component system nitrate/nitrite sensor histidine kinase NarX
VLGGDAVPGEQDTLPSDRPEAEDIDALMRSHEALANQVQALEHENAELRRTHTAQVIPEAATDSVQRACLALTGSPVDATLLTTVLADLNAALGSSRVTLTFNGPLWTDTALENVRVIPEAPRLIDEPTLLGLLNGAGVHQYASGAAIAVPVGQGPSTYAVLVAEMDGAVFAPWQTQLVRTFSGTLAVALVAAATHQRSTKQLLLEQRTALAGKLHDSLLPSISLTKLQLGRLQMLASRMGSWGSDELSHVANEVRAGMDQSVTRVRELLTQLRPPAPRNGADRERH